MKKISIFLAIALVAIISSCGGSGQSADEQNADSLATVETAEQGEPQITLTVESDESTRLNLTANANNTQVKIVSGERDTSFMIGEEETVITYLPSSNTITIYGNITKFNCFNNNTVTAIDISKNTHLQELKCGFNPISELDVSKNTALTHLGCGKTFITELDVSKNTNLEFLDCRLNKLTTLNLSKNTKLTYLDCGSCELTDIDISNNMFLTFLDVSANKLSSLDLSKNTKLTNITCDVNKLGNLDVSKNTALKVLSCDGIGITKFNLSNNPDITNIYISNNPIFKENPENAEILFNSLPEREGEQGVITCEDINDCSNSDKLKKIAKEKNWVIDYENFDGDSDY